MHATYESQASAGLDAAAVAPMPWALGGLPFCLRTKTLHKDRHETMCEEGVGTCFGCEGDGGGPD